MKIVDLTQTLKQGMSVYPGDPGVKIQEIHSLKKYGWRLKLLSFGSHTGTHVDAPSHMVKSGKTLDELPLNKFIAKACLVKTKDKFPQNIGLIFSSGKINLDLLDKTTKAKPLFVAVGNKAELALEMERELLKRKIITFTNLVNLEKLPQSKAFTFYGIPLKIKNGDGSPIRAFVFLD